MDILCTQVTCDIILSDTSWSGCKGLVSQSFYQGAGIAKVVPRDSLSNFNIKSYCLKDDERVVDYEKPHQLLSGNLTLVRDGILQRTGTGPGIKYIKIGPNEVEEPFSVYKDIALQLIGLDTEDASTQILTLDCKGGLCDVELGDTSFSTCIKDIPGDRYLGGLARATAVPQNSLHNFDLPLYCTSDLSKGINYTAPAATLKGNLIFYEGGIVQRTATGVNYVNVFNGVGDENALTTNGSSFYQGFRYDNGGAKFLSFSCQNKNCEVIIFSSIEPACIALSGGRLFLNGVATNKTVPQDSLDNFEIELYCLPQGPGAAIDYDTQDPISTIKASITPSDKRGIIRLVEDDNEDNILFKLSSGE